VRHILPPSDNSKRARRRSVFFFFSSAAAAVCRSLTRFVSQIGAGDLNVTLARQANAKVEAEMAETAVKAAEAAAAGLHRLTTAAAAAKRRWLNTRRANRSANIKITTSSSITGVFTENLNLRECCDGAHSLPSGPNN
jgi:hypothetical protein